MTLVRIGVGAVVAVVVGAALVALTGCQGPTTAAPTPVQSSDLTSSDGGFDRHAVVGVVLPAADGSLGTALGDRLDAAGFRSDVRVAPEQDGAAAQREAVDALVRGGAKAVLVRAVDASALAGVLQTAHDAGVVVVSLGGSLPASGTGGDGVSADYRVPGGDDEDALVDTTVDVVRSLQRGEKPTVGD